jgi:PhnB protein
MAAVLNPYLNFNGNAREAITFYQQVLGGESTSAPSPSSAAARVATVSCTPSSRPPTVSP